MKGAWVLRSLAAPIGPALAEAAAQLAAAPAGTAEEWQLPGAAHTLDGAATLDVSGRIVRLRGSEACTLAFAAGGLSLRADTVEIVELSIDAENVADGGAALRIEAGRIDLADVDAVATGAGAVVAVELLAATGTGEIDIEDVSVRAKGGSGAVGLCALGGRVRVTGTTVGGVDGGSGGATGIRLGATGDVHAVEIEVGSVACAGGDALGTLVAAGGPIDIARLQAADVSGNNVVGVALFGFGTGTDALSAVDLEATDIHGTQRATGLFVAGPRRLALRGFTIRGVTGTQALGAVLVGGSNGGSAGEPDLQVGFGTVDRVVGSAGDACGLRIVSMPSPRRTIVRDIAISAIAGAPTPTGSTPAWDENGEPAWQGWAAAVLADLSDDSQPRAQVPALPDAPDVVGLAVTAVVDEVQPFLDEVGAGDVAVVDSSVCVVSGWAIQVETGLRPVWLRRTELSTALRAGYLEADQLVLANTTWDRLGAPLAIGPGEIRLFNSIFTRSSSTAGPIVLDPDADWMDLQASFTDGTDERLQDLGALPYVRPGAQDLPAALVAGSLPPPEEIDLRLLPGSFLHGQAVPPPADELDLSADDSLADRRLFVGAYPPEAAARCNLYDPLPGAQEPVAGRDAASPVVDYRARDGQALLSVMLDRARLAMPSWTDRGPADFTSMVLETVAERLDQIAYQQERTVAEGFLDEARLRRSVEDHVRPLDYDIDPGLSATTMLRFHLDLDRIADVRAAREAEAAITTDAARAAFLKSTLAGLQALADDGQLEIPTGTLVANQRDDDQVLVFATEGPLAYFPGLDAVALVADIQAGATGAVLNGTLPELIVGRWLVLWGGPTRGGHVVRVTTIKRGTDVVEVGWDPRRPLPFPLYAAAQPDLDLPAAVVLGNVIPAHHGVPLSALPSDSDTTGLGRFNQLLAFDVGGGPGLQVPLPYAPVSVQASGHPLPGDEGRRGQPAIAVWVGDDPWTRVDDLATAGPSEEVFALRTSADGRATLRFGDGVSGAALPAHANRIRLELAVGLGRMGNVMDGILTRLLLVPVDTARGPLSAWLFRESMETIREIVSVDNPIPALGGRDPEPIDRMRYRAPLLAACPLSAVTPDDYVRVACALPEVAGAHARLVPAAVRPAVRVTVLLRHEDSLDPDERLRRWVAIRSALEGARLLGFDVESVPPVWAPLDLDVVVDAHPHAEAGLVRTSVAAAVAGEGGLLDPDAAGLGGDVQLADLYRAVMSAPGVAAARVRRFRRLLPHAPERLQAGFIPIKPDEVAVVRGPARPAADGVLTITVCGGLR